MPPGDRIKAHREGLGLSISEAARRIHRYLPGLDSSDWSKIERGRREVKLREAKAFARVLKCAVEDLTDELEERL